MLFHKGRKDQHSQGGDRGSWIAKPYNLIFAAHKLGVEPEDKFSISLVLFLNTTFYVLQREVFKKDLF